MSSRIMTLHPEGKQGVNIDETKYETVKAAIVSALEEGDAMSFTDLSKEVTGILEGNFKGSIMWYLTTVKLDLEARGILHCMRGKGRQMIRLAL